MLFKAFLINRSDSGPIDYKPEKNPILMDEI